MRFHEHHFSGSGMSQQVSLAVFFGADDESWMADSLCAQTDPDAFFPNQGEATSPAKKICLNCDVRAECLDYAIANREMHGVWGGLVQRELRKLYPDQPTEGTTAA